MENCVKDTEAIDFAIKSAKKIVEIVGKINLVFPAYKLKKEEVKEIYKSFAEAMARKNLIGYDQMTMKNKRVVELYELAIAMLEVAESFLEEAKKSGCQKKNFLAAACIL